MGVVLQSGSGFVVGVAIFVAGVALEVGVGVFFQLCF